MRPKQQTLLITAAIFCINTINAQFSSFDLSRYKTADYQRRELVFSGDLSGKYSENKTEDFSSSYRKIFNSSFALDYYSVKNTRKVQKDVFLKFSLNPVDYDLSSEHRGKLSYFENIKYNNITNGGMIYIQSNYRKYFRSNTFYEIDINGNISALRQKDDEHHYYNSGFQKSNNTMRYLIGNMEVPVKLGFGRIENVEDARMSIFILESLQKNQQLSKEISDEDILLFAEKITQLKNKRHFDSRKRRIYEIQALDSFMREKGIVASQNAVYYSNLIDNWGYAYNPLRQSGTRFSFGVVPIVSYDIRNYLSQSKNSNLSKGIEVVAELRSEKPLSLKWQRSVGVTSEYTKTGNKETIEYNGSGDSKVKHKEDRAYLSGYWGYGYYPDSRSYHQLLLGPYAGKKWNDWDESNPNYEKSKWDCGAELTLRGYIYFSERLFANYNLGVNYSQNKDKTEIETSKSNNFGTSFNLSFAYSIF